MNYRWIILGGVALVALFLFLFTRGPSEASSVDLIVSPVKGPFEIEVTTTGELRAKNSVKIMGPQGAQQARIFEMKIQKLVPEGTVLKAGDFVAELDRSELTTQIKDAQLEVETASSKYTQARLDTTLTLSEARDALIGLRYAMEESLLQKEEARFEAPSIKRRAEIDFEKAERTLNRSTGNYQTKVQQGVAQMREVAAELSKARNKLTQLEEIASQFTITAPENGMLIYKRGWSGQRLTEGGTVRAWDPVVAELPDLTQMESVTFVNEIDIQKIKVGQTASIGLDAIPDRLLTGKVVRVANIGEQRPNSDAKVFEVTLEIAEADSTLRPAMTTSNSIQVTQIPDALSIPLEAVHTLDSLSFVYTDQGRGLIRKEVSLGAFNEDGVVVQDGLGGEDQVWLSIPDNGPALDLVRLDEPDSSKESEPEKATAESRQ